MLQVGITGGIGSGKSIVCKIFRTLGVPIYDADSQAKRLMTTDTGLVASIKEEFGEMSYLSNGELNRAYLAEKAFSSNEHTKKLNALVHPAVAKDYATWAGAQISPYTIKEAALLIESGSYQQLDKLIVVTAPIDLRITRIKKRDPLRSESEIRNIMAKQLSDQEREARADFLIKNNESELLTMQVLELDKYFRSLV